MQIRLIQVKRTNKFSQLWQESNERGLADADEAVQDRWLNVQGGRSAKAGVVGEMQVGPDKESLGLL